MRFPYPRMHFAIRFLTLTAIIAVIAFLVPVPDGVAGGYLLAFWAMCFIGIMIMTVTPLLTAHEMDEIGIHLRNGLVFTISIRFEDVASVEEVGTKPWTFGFVPAGGKVILANGNRNLVSIKLKSRRRFRSLLGRSFNEIVIDLVSPDEFVKMANLYLKR